MAGVVVRMTNILADSGARFYCAVQVESVPVDGLCNM